jgi:NTP pyrophosphatase (non-canonical NTP hydrolase)
MYLFMEKSLTLDELKKLIMAQAEEKGFGVSVEDINVPEKLALIHSEISEAFEAHRHKKLEGEHGFGEELGDAVQRILHLAGVMDVDIEAEILKKINKNKSRDWDNMNETRA